MGVVVLITIVFTRHTAAKNYALLRPQVVVTSFGFTRSWVLEFQNVFPATHAEMMCHFSFVLNILN